MPAIRWLISLALLILGLITMARSARAQQTSNWYPFTATSDPAAGEIGMQDWLDRPAGKHGRITRQADQLIYNGQPIKLWGLNLCFGNCVPPKDLADRRAAFYPKYGINSVRLHKFVESDYQSPYSAVEYNPEALDRMDYQIARFKEAGIYVNLSVHFGPVILGPADRKFVPYIDELGTFKLQDGKPVGRISAAHSALFYSPELQALHRQQMLNLLQHRNPYTKLTYAEDPAIAFIEIVNEQSILFWTTLEPLKRYPTIRKMTAERFSDWLKAKYGTHEALAQAWGERAFDSFENEGFPKVGEHLDQRNILPIGNPYFFDPANLEASQAFRKQRCLDTLQFLYELQAECYERYVDALRNAGYEGEILGSNWQAGRSLSHFANLHADWRVGTIDRHNYFGGGDRRGQRPFNNGSMLQRAGSGLLSTGMQQAADRPFMLSEWIHVYPNEYGVEGPAIIGAYGLGLQGWDASYLFQNGDDGRFSPLIGRDQWDAVAPQVLGIFPAVARQVLRGDVRQSDVLAPRNVHVPSLFENKISFDDKMVQGYDQKELDSSKVPARALAAVRSVVSFTDTYQETPVFDMGPYERDGSIVSSTNQLRWTEGKEARDGFFTIDTDSTKAVVGFAQGRSLDLSGVTIRPDSHFAAVYVTAQPRDQTLATAKRFLIVAMARARNTDMRLSNAEDMILAKGQAPILLEPVRATITLPRHQAGTPTVTALDHDGRRTDKTLPVLDGTITIDGTKDQTPYYLVEYP